MNIVFCFRALFIVERRRRSSSKGEGEDKLWSRAHHMTAQVNRGGYRVGKEDELGYAEEEESRPAQRRKEEKEKAKLGGACWANATGPLFFFLSPYFFLVHSIFFQPSYSFYSTLIIPEEC